MNEIVSPEVAEPGTAVIELGTVCHTVKGETYVYVGFNLTTVGTRNHVFCYLHRGGLWQYHAVYPATLKRKFPDLVMIVVEPDFSAACET